MRRSADRGSLALEYVIAAPALLLVFALLFAFARVGEIGGELDTATRAAARTVTQLPDLSRAPAEAKRVVTEQLQELDEGGCTASTVEVTVIATRPDGGRDSVPAPGDTVTVQATCSYTLSDVGLPFPFGTMHATSEFSSVVDPNRGG